MLCKYCSLEKSSEEFSKWRRKCRECRNKEQTRWRKTYGRSVYLKGLKNRRNRPENINKQKIFYSKWYKENGRIRTAIQLEAIEQWRQKHPLAQKAYTLVKAALKQGNLIRPSICEKCPNETKLHAHHQDYNKPLEVIWLCVPCHKEIHKA